MKNAQYIAIDDYDNNYLEIDGIVTANPMSDIVVIKLKNKIENKVDLAETSNVNVEDPAFIISSKFGLKFVLQKGIIISHKEYIETTIPLDENDEGSPLINSDGKVIGINKSSQEIVTTSQAIDSGALYEIQNKFNNFEFSNISFITFDELKDKYYYNNYNEEIIKNTIPSNIWKKYSKIGDIENNIKLKLTKANYKDGIVSLRYYNDISNYINNNQISAAFKSELLNQEYKETFNSTKKSIYQNSKYKIIIMNEFDYLIVVMVRL